MPLYTNILTTEQYGTVDLVLTFSGLLFPVVSLSISEAILFFGLREQQKERVLQSGLVVLLLGFFLTIAIVPFLGMYQSVKEYVWYIVLYTNVTSVRTALLMYTKANEKNTIYSYGSMVHALLMGLCRM